MSIDRLRYFAAVVETQNLRQAAELVGISPPSMSKAISVLEGELGVKLLHPEGRGIGITSKGLEIYRSSTALLGEYRRFQRHLKEQKAHKALFRMATFEVFSSYFFSSFLQHYEEADILLLEMVPGKIEQAILNGTVNLGITYLPAPDPSLEYREIGSFKMGIYGQKKWENIPFSEWPFAVPTAELRIHSSEIDSLDMWPKKAPKRNIKFQFELLETALQTARTGLSVLHCPDFITLLQNEQVKPSCQLVKLPFPAGYRAVKPIKVYLVGRKGDIPHSLERKLAKFIRSFGY
jgi:DNA-binding transcriptional LysR family regulator